MKDGPLHGYAIRERVRELSGRRERPGQGSVYGALRRLKESGLIEEIERHFVYKRQRVVYDLTPRGARVVLLDGLHAYRRSSATFPPTDHIAGLIGDEFARRYGFDRIRADGHRTT